MADFFIAFTFILLLLGGWIGIQYLSRQFAARHPEFGPAKEEGSGCGQSCLCGTNARCRNKHQSQIASNKKQYLTQNHQEKI